MLMEAVWTPQPAKLGVEAQRKAGESRDVRKMYVL